MSTPKLVFGGGIFSSIGGLKSVEEVKPWLNALLESKDIISGIDTAVAYGESEQWLGELGFGSHFAIFTKLPGPAHPTVIATKENVVAQTHESLRNLGLTQLDTLFLHGPDTRVPFEETLCGIDTMYKQHAFKCFGLSNHTAEQVEEVVKICKEKNYVLPSVFQGSYSAVSRLPEDELFPVLRKHNISFMAYSPIAGGFLAKTSQQFRDQSFQGRWDQAGYLGKVYQYIYNRPAVLEALDRWHEIAAAEGISSVEMAHRWVAHNSSLDASKGDSIVVGATTIQQWKDNLAAIQKGALSAEATAKIDALWSPIKSDAVLDNWIATRAIMTSPM